MSCALSEPVMFLGMRWFSSFAFQPEGKRRGRPPKGQLRIPVFAVDGEDQHVNLSEIARKTSTTRKGARQHKRAMQKIEVSKVCFVLFYFVLWFHNIFFHININSM